MKVGIARLKCITTKSICALLILVENDHHEDIVFGMYSLYV